MTASKIFPRVVQSAIGRHSFGQLGVSTLGRLPGAALRGFKGAGPKISSAEGNCLEAAILAASGLLCHVVLSPSVTPDFARCLLLNNSPIVLT
jgi:hypothetical protein